MIKNILISVIILILTFNILISKTYNYDISFSGIKGGKASLEIHKKGKFVYAMFIMNTTGFVDRFYSVRDTVKIIASYPEYHTILLDKIAHEGKTYHKHIIMDVRKIDSTKLTNPIRDEYTAMIMLMDSIYSKKNSVKLNLWKKKKKVSYEFEKTNIEKIKFNGKKILCNYYEPTAKSSSKLEKKGGTGLSIWMTKTTPMNPIVVKVNMKLGHLLLELVEK
ncbi:MAG: DUF3108 domain-containing protein [Candidatus Marinimicrobia bacterium]|nr:DUF3108 domain-containing protein [Candidatus Neomarinimicrobiota bacterium]